MQGGLVFVVDDILLTYIVLPYGTRLLDQGRNKLYDWLDSELGKEGKKLKKSIAKRNVDDVEALKQIGQYVADHHGTADTLATAAFAAELGAAKELPPVQGDEEFLGAVRDYFLTPTVEMVRALGRPAVLPGFLTGTDWLTAIDVRTVPPAEKLDQLRIYSQYGKNPARINLWSSPGPLGVQHWLPRLWLIKAADEELARDLGTTPGHLAAALDELAVDKHTTAQRFATALESQAFVTGITRDDVIVDHARMPLDFTPILTRESYQIPWAASPAGIRTMRTALTRQVGDRQRQVETWLQALKN
jgi:hypothetical protein